MASKWDDVMRTIDYYTRPWLRYHMHGRVLNEITFNVQYVVDERLEDFKWGLLRSELRD